MNAERLLAHFERISEAPDAIARLRRFILDLAVRGKLVEPPRSWLECSLGDVGDWGSGGTPLRTKPEYYGGDIPWLVIGDLNDGLVTASATTITEEGLSNSSAKVVDEGTLLIAMYGSIGKLGVAGMRCATNQAIAFCRPYSDMVTGDYLFVLLKSLRNELLLQGQGVAQQNISQKILKAHPVELPPLAEQHRIVAKVDELMALCDQLEAARHQREQGRERLVAATLHRLNQPAEDPTSFHQDANFSLQALPSLTTTPAQIKQLRQTILNLAVRGKLVEQDPEDEPVQGFIDETRIQLQPKWPTPSSWRWVRLRDIGRLKGGGTPSKARDDFWHGDIPWVSPKDMKVDYLNGAQLSITDAAIKNSAVNLVEPQSILFVVRGMILAHSFPVAISKAPLTINQDMKALVPRQIEMSEYLLRALKGLKPEILKKVQRSSHGTCRIEGKDYSDFPIPLPPLAEQHRIVAKVDELMALCDQLEQRLSQADQQRGRLLEAVLAEALQSSKPALSSESRV
jgi:type I restriction enzyme S subunit